MFPIYVCSVLKVGVWESNPRANGAGPVGHPSALLPRTLKPLRQRTTIRFTFVTYCSAYRRPLDGFPPLVCSVLRVS